MPMYYALLLVFPTVTCCVCQHSIKALLTYLLTLNDPYSRFQGHTILWRWISQKRYEIGYIVSMELHILNSVILNYLEWLNKIFNDTKRRARSLRQLSFLSTFFQVSPTVIFEKILAQRLPHRLQYIAGKFEQIKIDWLNDWYCRRCGKSQSVTEFSHWMRECNIFDQNLMLDLT